MLLGPGDGLLDFRTQVKGELVEQGYTDILIMEEIENSLTDTGMNGKFERIVKMHNPTLFIAFFHKGADMGAVLFEIGYICGKYGTGNVRHKLRLLGEKDYDWDNTTAYIKTLFPKLPKDNFDETKPYSKASERIRLFIINM